MNTCNYILENFIIPNIQIKQKLKNKNKAKNELEDKLKIQSKIMFYV